MVGGYGIYVHVVPQKISGYDFDKYYVGITTLPFVSRWGNDGHGYNYQPFGGAVKKYGWNNIKHYIISDHQYTEIDAKIFEQCLIKGLRSFRGWGFGYNGTLGGDGRNGISSPMFKDISGQIFGRLKVLYRTNDHISPSGNRRVVWHCVCQCEKHTEIDVTYNDLSSGNTTSCGCYAQERRSQKKLNHYEFYEDKVIGYTFNGDSFILDIEDYENMNKYRWHKSKNMFVSVEEINGHRVTHNLLNMILKITNLYSKVNIKFKNGKTNDYRKSNLTIVVPNGADKNDYMNYLKTENMYHVNFIVQSKSWRVDYNNGKNSKNFKNFDDALLFWAKNGDTPPNRSNSLSRPIICINSLEIIEGGAPDAVKYTNVKRATISHSCAGRNEYGGKNLATGEKLKWMLLDDYNNLSEQERQVLIDNYYTGNNLVLNKDIKE